MKIALGQFDIAWEDKEANRKRIRSLVEETPDFAGTDWLILPEYSLTAFTLDPAAAALTTADLDFFAALARDYSTAVSFGGIRDGKNGLFTWDKTGRHLTASYKTHMFSHGHEEQVCRPGDPCPFILGGCRIAPFVCYDLRFSYLFWDRAAATDVYVVIANFPTERAHHWRTLLTARAIENQAYVVGVNRVGKSPRQEYSGGSLVVSPTGEEILNCGDREGVFFAEVEKQVVEKTRASFPILQDRKK